MKMTRENLTVGTILAGMLVLVSAGIASRSSQADPPASQAGYPAAPEKLQDVVTTAVESGHFKTLARALEAAGLVEALKEKGPYTVFAPTDEAFAQLPSGVLNDLLKPENKDRLKAILMLHVVPGAHPIAHVKKMKDATTLGGAKVDVTHHLLTGVHIGNTKGMAHVKNSDINASNGVIHVIDKVLMP